MYFIEENHYRLQDTPHWNKSTRLRLLYELELMALTLSVAYTSHLP